MMRIIACILLATLAMGGCMADLTWDDDDSFLEILNEYVQDEVDDVQDAPAAPHVPTLPTGDHAKQAAELTAKLEKQGYTVQKGVYGYFTAEMCALVASCYANNPPSPYGLIYLPPGPNEDVSTYSKWGAILKQEVDGVEMSTSYRLDRGETLLMLGQTPPRSLYYSWVPYVFDRWNKPGYQPKNADMGSCKPVDPKTSPNGERCEVFASLGNPLNMVNVKTQGNSFNSAIAVFMGGDEDQIAHVQKVSASVGVDEDIHNVYPLSTERVKFGTGEDDNGDGFVNLGRITFTEDPAEKQEYLDHPETYVTVLRITPPADAKPGPSFPENKFNERVTEKEQVASEGISHGDLQKVVAEDLAKAVMEDPSFKKYKYRAAFPPLEAPKFSDGYDCLEDGIKCNGDNQDTLYPNSASALVMEGYCKMKMGNKCPTVKRTTLAADGSDFFLATGVNHNLTESALYSSICMYSMPRLESIGQFSSMPLHLDANSYVGSAERFLPGHPLAKYLWAVKVSRKCGKDEPYCLQVSAEGANSLAVGASCMIIERVYMDQMRVGPDDDATVKPIVYHFSAKR